MRNQELDHANAPPGPPSEVISRYLEAIFYMRAEGESVRSARLADWLGVSRPTVTAGVRRMLRDGLVRFTPHKEIELTAEGDRKASSIVRRHRIMERWLTETLGLDWVAADEEAARLEHAISEVVEERLYESLGRPQTCPHGNPIPGHSEAVKGELRLAGLSSGTATVTRISEVAEREAPSLLRYLHERRLVPGSPVTVREVDVVGKTIRLSVGDREVTLSHDTAGKIWVLPG